jgi:hypothetical protein
MALSPASFTDFGTLLRVLRRRARLTQRQLGMAVGYSEAQICRLEQGKRLPDPTAVAALFLPSLGLSSEPGLAARVHELALAARDKAAGTEEGGGPGQAAAGEAGDLAGIPVPPSPQVTRPAAAAELREHLVAHRLVLVWGAPGVGKSSLAAAVAREKAAHMPVCWLTLTPGITSPAEAVIRTLARFLAAHGQQEASPGTCWSRRSAAWARRAGGCWLCLPSSGSPSTCSRSGSSMPARRSTARLTCLAAWRSCAVVSSSATRGALACTRLFMITCMPG